MIDSYISKFHNLVMEMTNNNHKLYIMLEWNSNVEPNYEEHIFIFNKNKSSNMGQLREECMFYDLCMEGLNISGHTQIGDTLQEQNLCSALLSLKKKALL